MILIKNFNTNNVSRARLERFADDAQIAPSGVHKRKWYKKSLNILRDTVDPELYVLCPIYTLKGNKDFQIGLTGSKDRADESLFETLDRELKEEAGLIVNLKNMKSYYEFKEQHSEKTKADVLLYIENIKNFKYMRPHKIPDYIPDEHSQRFKKIVCFPVGTLSEVNKYLRTKIGRGANLIEHRSLREIAALPIWYLIDIGLM